MAVIRDMKFKVDNKGNECAYIYLETKKGDMIVQKYTPTSFEELSEAIQKAGGSEHLKATMVEWKLVMAGRMQNRRLFPEPQPKETKK